MWLEDQAGIVCGNPPIKRLAYSGVAATPEQPWPLWEAPLLVSECASLEDPDPIGKALWTLDALMPCGVWHKSCLADHQSARVV